MTYHLQRVETIKEDRDYKSFATLSKTISLVISHKVLEGLATLPSGNNLFVVKINTSACTTQTVSGAAVLSVSY